MVRAAFETESTFRKKPGGNEHTFPTFVHAQLAAVPSQNAAVATPATTAIPCEVIEEIFKFGTSGPAQEIYGMPQSKQTILRNAEILD